MVSQNLTEMLNPRYLKGHNIKVKHKARLTRSHWVFANSDLSLGDWAIKTLTL